MSLRRSSLLAAALAVAAAAACAGTTHDDARVPGPAVTSAAPAIAPTGAVATRPTLPAPGKELHPSLMVVKNKDARAGERISDVESCAGCHADAADAWRSSAHAFASFNNPVYRSVVERFRKDRGNDKSQFCGGCHDIALMVDGAMTAEVDPKDPRAYAGVSCRTCHGIDDARPDGNASYTLDVSDIPVPKPGDPESALRHRARVGTAALRTAQMCGSCHRSFLDESTGNSHHLVGQDDLTPFMRSAYAGTHGARIDDVGEQDCRGCHMPKEDAKQADQGAKQGKIASHRFVGAHTWLAQMIRDPEQERRAAEFVKGSATIDVAGVVRMPAGLASPAQGRRSVTTDAPIPVAAGEHLVLDVVVKNERTGHRFPGGVMDAQDTWIEVVVEDRRGRRVAAAGAEHAATGADPTAHRFSSYMADKDGNQLHSRETHLFQAGVYNHTIAPRDAALVSYDLELPAWVDAASLPLKVTAKLQHRTRNLALQATACDATRTERGKAFGREGLKKVARALDPCKPQPVVTLGTSEALLGEVPARAEARSWRSTYDYALGLSHHVQERLDEARDVAMIAVQSAKAPRERAMASQLMADVLAHQGMVQDARVWIADVETHLKGHPASQRILGETYKTTWEWEKAAAHFASAAEGAARDDSLFAELAVLRGGAGDHAGALAAAQPGLRLQPRDADLLRVQALAMDSLGGPASERALATAAFLERRTPDAAPGIRAKCSARVPGCANERLPVHSHAMIVRR